MNIIHVVFAIILMGQTDCFIDDTTDVKALGEQKILLRKLRDIQDPKPLTWNEILADVLVNKIKIFSFKKESADIKEEAVSSNNIVTKWFSVILYVYKNCVYDKYFTVQYEEPSFYVDHVTTEPNYVGVDKRDGPKSEVEIIEPKYHGKVDEANPTVDGDVATLCPTGMIKDEKGDCIKEKSDLMISVPNQCPLGYRADRLGNCRIVW